MAKGQVAVKALALLLLCILALAGCGTGNSNATTASVTAQIRKTARVDLHPPKFAYVANQKNGISAYTVDPSAGALKPIAGSPFAAGTSSTAIAADPDGHFLYVADSYLNAILVYNIDQATGALTKSFAVHPAGTQPGSLAVHPSGKWLYAANRFSGNVSQYSINTNTGALTELQGSPVAVGGWLYAIAIDPTGRFAYSADYKGNRIVAFVIDQDTGGLTPTGSIPAATNPDCIAISPTGNMLYVGTIGSKIESIAGFHIDMDTGALSAAPVLSFPFGVGTFSLAFDPYGRWLYSANQVSGSTSIYKPEPTGALTFVHSYGVAGDRAPNQVTVDPSGQFVYVTDVSGTVMAFKINQSKGTLAPIAGSPFAAGDTPVAIVVTH